jgi:hypothetical protein
VWLPAWLPGSTDAGALVVVFKTIRNALAAAAFTWTFSMPACYVTHDHPAHIPRSPQALRPELKTFNS